MMESAREAVMNGMAGEKEVRMAAKGVEVDWEGKVIPAEDGHGVAGQANGGANPSKGQAQEVKDGAIPVRDRMDISLHNFGDYMDRGY